MAQSAVSNKAEKPARPGGRLKTGSGARKPDTIHLRGFLCLLERPPDRRATGNSTGFLAGFSPESTAGAGIVVNKIPVHRHPDCG
jgi:hypothetical protein